MMPWILTSPLLVSLVLVSTLQKCLLSQGFAPSLASKSRTLFLVSNRGGSYCQRHAHSSPTTAPTRLLLLTRVRRVGLTTSMSASEPGSEMGLMKGVMVSLLCIAAILGGTGGLRISEEVAKSTGLIMRPMAARALSDEQVISGLHRRGLVTSHFCHCAASPWKLSF